MRTAIVLPSKYEAQLIHESKKCGLTKEIDIEPPYPMTKKEYRKLEKTGFNLSKKNKRELFQMILLYDEIIVPGIDPTYNYDDLIETQLFSITSIDEYLSYASNVNLYENCDVNSQYLKPALLPVVYDEIASYYNSSVKEISKSDFVENIYNAYFTKKTNGNTMFSSGMEKAFDLSASEYRERQENRLASRTISKEIKDALRKNNTLWSFLSTCISYNYEKLNMLLDYANERNAVIMNCEYSLDKIGCYDYDSSSLISNYATIKAECKDIIGKLPEVTTLHELIDLKESKRNAIYRLRSVLNEFEDTLRNSGKESAIKKIKHDTELAVKDLNQGVARLETVSEWTLILAISCNIAEIIISGFPSLSLPIDIIGATALIKSKYMKKKNSWVNIIR